MAIQKSPQSAKTQIDTFLNVFSGADGGVAFVYFKARYESIEQKALAGDPEYIEIMAKVQGVVNLIQLLGDFDNEADLESK